MDSPEQQLDTVAQFRQCLEQLAREGYMVCGFYGTGDGQINTFTTIEPSQLREAAQGWVGGMAALDAYNHKLILDKEN